MIMPALKFKNRTSKPRDIREVWVSTTEAEAFETAARVRRQVPRGAGWKVRTSERGIKADGVELRLFVVTAWRPAEKRVASACSPDDSHNELT